MSETFDANDETLEPISTEEPSSEVIENLHIDEDVQEDILEIKKGKILLIAQAFDMLL